MLLNTEAESDIAEDNEPKNLMCCSNNCQKAKIPTRWLWKNGSTKMMVWNNWQFSNSDNKGKTKKAVIKVKQIMWKKIGHFMLKS